jgi:hypothetical protein
MNVALKMSTIGKAKLLKVGPSYIVKHGEKPTAAAVAAASH